MIDTLDINHCFNETFTAERYKLNIEQRSITSRMGRFGGGWNYRLGLTASGKTMLINSEVFSMRLTLTPKIASIHRTFEIPGYSIRIDMNIPANVVFNALLQMKKVTMTSSAKEVFYRISSVGTIKITKLKRLNE